MTHLALSINTEIPITTKTKHICHPRVLDPHCTFLERMVSDPIKHPVKVSPPILPCKIKPLPTSYYRMNTFPQLLFLIFTFALAEKATAQFNPGSAFVQSANLFDQVGQSASAAPHATPRQAAASLLQTKTYIHLLYSILAQITSQIFMHWLAFACTRREIDGVWFLQDLLVDLGVQLAESQRSPEGDTPANVVIERAVSFPQAGGSDVIVLRNVGGKVADLSNWEIRDSSPSEPPFKLDPLVCGDVLHLTGGESLQLFPASPENRCGFEFGLSYKY